MSLIWIDLETTGLRSDQCSVLEVAAIATDDDFHEIARIERVIYYPHAARIVEMIDAGLQYKDMRHRWPDIIVDPYVLEMHDKNGLWRACVHGMALDTVDRDLEAFVKAYATGTETVVDKDGQSKERTVLPQLAGSTISFDRAFIDAHLPRLAKTLHYRNLDTSTLNEVSRRAFVDVYNARPNAGRAKELAKHRGMDDIQESIAVTRHYVQAFGRGLAAAQSVASEG